MKKDFIYVEERESIDNYLSRAARWMDSVRTKEPLENGLMMEELLTYEEIKELENYIFTLIEKCTRDVLRTQHYRANIADVEDDYRQEFLLLIWKNFPKYNNPKYTSSNELYTFSTFLNIYKKEPIRAAISKKIGLTSGVIANRRKIAKVRSFLAAKYKVKQEEISAEEIFEEMPKFTKRPLSLNVIEKLMKECYKHNLEYMDEQEDAAVSDEWINNISEESIKEEMREIFSNMRPWRRFVFLQSYGYGPCHMDSLSIKDLAETSEAVRICAADPYGVEHLRIITGAYGNKNRKAFSLGYALAIDEEFIANERKKTKQWIIDKLREKGYDKNEIKANFFDVMREEGEKIEDELNRVA